VLSRGETFQRMGGLLVNTLREFGTEVAEVIAKPFLSIITIVS